jgi:hypothetical protein
VSRSRAVVVLLVSCLVVSLWQGVPLVLDAAETVGERRDQPVDERRLAAAFSIGLDPAVLHGAVRELPLDARYAVVVGRTLPLPGVLEGAVSPLLNHWLFPRRHTSLAEADWVVTYGHPTETLGVPIAREVQILPGISVAEIGR